MKLTTVPASTLPSFLTRRHSLSLRWGQPLLFGPGSVHVAHTAEEFVSIAELHAAVEHYQAIAAALLERCSAEAVS